MSSNLFKVMGPNGSVFYLDEDNHTVMQRDANGRLVNKTEFRAGLGQNISVADVHVDSTLSNYAAGYKLADSIIEDVAPTVLTAHSSDYYTTWDKEDAFQAAHSVLATENESLPEVSPRVSRTLFTTSPAGMCSFIGQGVIANADSPLNPRMAAISAIMNKMILNREVAGATTLMSGTTFSGYTSNIAAGNKWNGGAGSDPVKDLLTAIEAAYMSITNIVMSEQVWHDFSTNPNVMKYGMYKPGDSITPQALSAILQLPPFLVGKMKYLPNTSATSLSYVWGAGCLLIHKEVGPTINQQSVSTAKTFRWNKGGMGTDSNGFRTRTWFDPSRGQDGGEYVAVLSNEIVTATAPATGYYLGTCHQ